jgi:hypothetical protein
MRSSSSTGGCCRLVSALHGSIHLKGEAKKAHTHKKKKKRSVSFTSQRREETSRRVSRWIGAQENNRKWTLWKYYDAMPSPWTLSLSSLFGHGSLEKLRAVRAHAYTHIRNKL